MALAFRKTYTSLNTRWAMELRHHTQLLAWFLAWNDALGKLRDRSSLTLRIRGDGPASTSLPGIGFIRASLSHKKTPILYFARSNSAGQALWAGSSKIIGRKGSTYWEDQSNERRPTIRKSRRT
jgi:hypothetical protein